MMYKGEIGQGLGLFHSEQAVCDLYYDFGSRNS